MLKLPNFARQTAVRLTIMSFIGITSAILFPSTAKGQSFFEPTSGSGGITAVPLNSSGNTQRKSGSLIIGPNGAAYSYLCLNTDAVDSADPRCIKSWSDFGSFVHLWTNSCTVLSGAGANCDLPDAGYIRIKGKAGSQKYTFIAEAAVMNDAVGVYASDNNQATAFAGYFQGRVYVASSSSTTSNGQLCLNDTAKFSDANTNPYGCISNWSQITSQSPSGNYVYLQPFPGKTTAQDGGAAVSGSAVLAATTGGVVVGDPPAGLCPDFAGCKTCGDGVCSADEDTAKCPTDCPANMIVTIDKGAGPSGGTINITPAATGFPCAAGCNNMTAKYPAGTPVKVFASANSGYSFTWVSMPGGVCTSPGVSPCAFTLTGDVTIRPTFRRTPSLTVQVDNGGDPQNIVKDSTSLNCGTACATTYDQGTTAVLQAQVAPGGIYSFSGWSGVGLNCTEGDNTHDTCTIYMNDDKVVSAAFQRTPGTHIVKVTLIGGDGIWHDPIFTNQDVKVDGYTESGPVSLVCTNQNTPCSAGYADGTSLRLMPSYRDIWRFSSWKITKMSGSPTFSTASNYTFKVTGDTEVVATFTPTGSSSSCSSSRHCPWGLSVE